MRWRTGLIFIVLSFAGSTPSWAFNVTSAWAGDGGFKLPRQDIYPEGCSTCTLTANWDGTSAYQYAAKNETVSLVLFLGNNNVSVDATSVTVVMSPLVNGSSVISSTPVLPSGVTNYTTRPIEEFIPGYLQINGISQLEWDPTEYEARDQPVAFRRPCTINVNNDCVPNGGTLWTDRPDHNKFLPDPLIPVEVLSGSTFTVSASSSQAVWFDIYVPKTAIAGTYTGTITIYEGAAINRNIPFNLTVYNFTLPDTPTYKVTVGVNSAGDINYRHYGVRYPSAGSPYQDTRQHYYEYFHRHKFAATMGDTQGAGGNCAFQDAPCPEYVNALNGSIYTTTYGYGNAPGIGVGDQDYTIGMFGGWPSANWSSTVTGGTNGFCINVDDWGSWFAINDSTATAFLYLADETLTNVPMWSTWMSTVTACQYPTYRIRSWVTSNWPDIESTAPNIDMAVSTGWISASSPTWVAAQNYFETGTKQAWGYNGHPSWAGSDATEDDGISYEEVMWGDWKKGVEGHFFWAADYWTDTANGNRNNDLFNNAQTFGGTSTTYDTVKGQTSYQYTNGDGVLVYPGHDVINTPDYGFDGPIGSWRLKMIRRGIQDVDYIAMAYTVNPSSTVAIVNQMVPNILYEHSCFTLSDCTYSYGGRSWSNDPNQWELARQRLATIIQGAPTPPSPTSIKDSFIGMQNWLGQSSY